MKHNIVYITALVLGIILIFLYLQISAPTEVFYGFAENKETDISHDENLLIQEIYVTDGQEVKAGDMLLKATNPVFTQKIKELQIDKQSEAISLKLQQQEYDAKLSDLKNAKESAITKLNDEITEIKARIATKEKMYDVISSVNKPEAAQTADHLSLAALESELSLVSKRYDDQINNIKSIQNNLTAPLKTINKKIESESKFLNNKVDQLIIKASQDGLIGSIGCKEGEHIPAYNTLMGFYKHNPTAVKGYVHESMILHVNVGNKLEVSSTINPEKKILGEVTGLGSRIVEIPERLRKMPEIKSYGREVIISIPSENEFLQKEKVILNTLEESNTLGLKKLFSNLGTHQAADNKSLDKSRISQ